MKDIMRFHDYFVCNRKNGAGRRLDSRLKKNSRFIQSSGKIRYCGNFYVLIADSRLQPILKFLCHMYVGAIGPLFVSASMIYVMHFLCMYNANVI
eukprot:Gb_13917 [translate_table: standard]